MNAFNNALNELKRWIDNVNGQLQTNMPFIHIQPEIDRVRTLINSVAQSIQPDYPFYAEELPRIFTILFRQQQFGGYSLNPCAFGELFIIVKHVIQEPFTERFWNNVHPRIAKVSKSLYYDKYYDSAAEKAVKEVETVLRELFSALKPNSSEPKNAMDIMNALLSDQTLYDFDTVTVSGKDYHRGIKQLFEACFAAYRNPSSHRNISIGQREAFEQIALASQLLYILETYRK